MMFEPEVEKWVGNYGFSIFFSGCKRFKSLHDNFRVQR